MSAARTLDELARALVQPVPRRRALRMLGVSLAAVVVPGVRPGFAGAATARGADSITCHNLSGSESWPCPRRKYVTCGSTKGECIDACTGPGTQPCGSGAGYDCCFDPLGVPGLIACKKGKCTPTCKGISYGSPVTLTECGDGCCDPKTERCNLQTSKCEKKCPPGQPPCGRKCCPRNQSCKQGKCCPNGRVCGNKCCGSGFKCAFYSLAVPGNSDTRGCCPEERIVKNGGNRFCCPPTAGPAGMFTVAVRGGTACCPRNRPNCCDDPLGRVPKPRGRTFCVGGRMQRL